ncbi:MAG: MATE family efflux transporter, partial [[Clostridium] nexile]
SLFSDDAQVLAIAVPALRANTIMFFTFGFQFTYSTLYLAMGKALAGGILNICRQGIMFIPVILLLPAVLGMNGVMYSQAVADLLTTLVTIYFAVKVHKQLKQV